MQALRFVLALSAAVAVVVGVPAGVASGGDFGGVDAELQTSSRNLGGAFLEEFDGPTGLNKELFKTSGYWSNGQPFNSGWDPSYWTVEKSTALVLFLRKEQFYHGEWDLPYTSGELRSHAEYGAGCYSVCMRAAAPSGVASSFYIQNFGPGGNTRGSSQNEIDIEFIGKEHTKLQTNFFSRSYDPDSNSGSGNEQMHDVGFDVTKNFAAYSMRWEHNRIDWWVNGYHLRTQHAYEGGPAMPSPYSIGMKISANVWAVNKQAEEWAGTLDPYFYETAAHYLWIHHDPGQSCQIKTECGNVPQGL